MSALRQVPPERLVAIAVDGDGVLQEAYKLLCDQAVSGMEIPDTLDGLTGA